MIQSNSRRQDAGDSLIEILMTIMILGVLAGALVTAMYTAAAGSGSHQDEAYAQSTAVAAAEQIKQASWVTCATTSSYLSQAQHAITSGQLPSTWTSSQITIPIVKYWTSTGWDTNPANCTDLNGPKPAPNGGLQLIEVEVQSPDHKAVEDVWLVKRNVLDQ